MLLLLVEGIMWQFTFFTALNVVWADLLVLFELITKYLDATSQLAEVFSKFAILLMLQSLLIRKSHAVVSWFSICSF